MAEQRTKQSTNTDSGAKKRTQDVEALAARLREEGQRVHDLFNYSPLGIYRTTLEGGVLLANPAVIRMLGYDSMEELMSVKVGEGFPYKQPEKREAFISRFDHRDYVRGFEVEWQRKDGATLYVRESARAIRDDEGNILYFEGTVEDISEKKQAEMQLELRLQSENLIASMSSKFANALLMEESEEEVIEETLSELAGFAGADTASVIAYWSGTRSIRREFAWWRDPDRISSIDKTQRISFDEEPWALKRLLRNEMVYLKLSQRTQKDAELEYRIMSEMGVDSLVMAPWICSDRTVGAVVLGSVSEEKVWTQDMLNVLKITAELIGSAYERKISYKKLHDEQKLVRTLLGNSPDRIYFKDRQCRFIRANTTLCERHGISDPSEIIGKTDRDLFTDLHAEEAYADDMRVMGTGVPVVAKEELETWADGSESWASTTKIPMYDDDGNVSGLMGISRDITARKAGEKERYKLELQMMQAQKMESLGVMCGGIAHDFNNFLMGILGNAGLALMEMAPESPAWNSVKQIETVALRAAELTNQLLAYSGKTEPERRIVDLSKLVREMAHLLRVSIPKSTDIDYSFTDELPGVDCDPVQIRQVVMNLMINASDAIDSEKGLISVETGVTHCDSDALAHTILGDDLDPGEYVYVKVGDNGIGMTKETIERIFDPFFTTKPSGHGLGMAVVMGVIKAHDGTISVESDSGKGTCFTILLPSAGKIETAKEDKKKAAVKTQKNGSVVLEILMVEDDDIVRTVSRKILENCGFNVHEACDGDAAVSILEEAPEGRYDLIMLDVTLPGTSGKDVLAIAKKTKKDVPIIVMSGYNEDSVKNDYGLSGYDGYLKKPFDAVKMTGLVKKCCGISDDHGGE